MTEEALRSTARFLERLIELPADATGRILSRVMSNPGMIHSGERMNVIAQRCELEMDMHYLLPLAKHLGVTIEATSISDKEMVDLF